MNSLISMILALCLLMSPSAGLLPEDMQPFSATLTGPEELNITVGLVEDATDERFLIVDTADFDIAASDETLYLTTNGKTYATPIEGLLAELVSALSGMPDLTQADMAALATFAQHVLDGISRDAWNLSFMNTGLSVSVDVDKLAHDLHTAVPAALEKCGAELDPAVAKLSILLFGNRYTTADIAAAWPTLKLDQVHTGLDLSLTVLQSGDVLNVIGSVSDVSFLGKFSESAMRIDITADGATYVIDSADLPAILQLASGAFSAISEDAFHIVQAPSADGEKYITTITVDTAALAADMNSGMAETIRRNSDSVDLLLNKYRSWFALTDPELAAQLSAATLAEAFDRQLISLPATTGELVVEYNEDTDSFVADGYFGSWTLNGTVTEDESLAAMFNLTLHDAYAPLSLDFQLLSGYRTSTISLTSSAKVLDLFHTITIHTESGRQPSWTLTTDTDAIRVSYQDGNGCCFDLKLGTASFTYRDTQHVFTLDFAMEDFYASLNGTKDHIHFDSSFGGFDFVQNRGGMTLTGYLNDHYRYQTTFGLTMVDTHEEHILSGFIATSSGEYYEAKFTGDAIHARAGGHEYTIKPYFTDSWSVYGYDFLKDGVIEGKLHITEGHNSILLEVYSGDDLTAEAMYALLIDAAPETFTVPADAIHVEPTAFLYGY